MKRRSFLLIDWSLWLLPLMLAGASIATIYSTTLGTNNSGMAIDQLVFVCIGILAATMMTIIDYRNFQSWAWIFYLISIILLVMVLIMGKTTYGATRWIDIGFTQIQPSEIFKFTAIIVLAGIMAKTNGQWLKKLLSTIIVIAVPLVLIYLQPDLGTAIAIVIIVLGMFMAWPIPKAVKAAVVGLLIICLPIGWLFLHDYQKERIYTFINPSRDPYGEGYNVIQSEIAVGSGGIDGRGLGNGPQSQLNFLPVSHTDFIFAGWSEATGFIGSITLIVILLTLSGRMYYIAYRTKELYGRFITIGFATMILGQSCINIGMNIGLAPVTGIPLPFMSAGGTSTVITFVLLGVVQSIYVRNHRMTEGNYK